jgi:RNA polymerase-interacting CarD/CdnL/TRCF family regulator
MLSLAGKNQYVKARQLLAGEIAIAHGLDLIEADAWIDIQLAAGTS